MAHEQFGALDLQELQEDERLCSSLPPADHDMTGLCSVQEITIRWGGDL